MWEDIKGLSVKGLYIIAYYLTFKFFTFFKNKARMLKNPNLAAGFWLIIQIK